MKGFSLKVSVTRGGESTFTLTVDSFPFTIGASPANDIVLDDPTVSSQHARVAVSRGKLQFTDRSTNGSYFQGKRISSQLLESGDVVEIPPFELRFEYRFEEEEERLTAYRPLSEMLTPEIQEQMEAARRQKPVATSSPAGAGPTAEEAAPPPATPEPFVSAADDVFGPLPEAPPPAPSPRPAVQDRAPLAHDGASTARAKPQESAAAKPAAAPPLPPQPPLLRAEPPVVFEPSVSASPPPPPLLGRVPPEPVPAAPAPPQRRPIPEPVRTPVAAAASARGADLESTERHQAPPESPPVRRVGTSGLGPPPNPPPSVDRAGSTAPSGMADGVAGANASACGSTGPDAASAAPTADPESCEKTGELNGAVESTVLIPMAALMEEPHAWLLVVDGPDELRGQTFPLPEDEITIGRGERADFRFELGNISRVHTRLVPKGKNEWTIRDLGSLNGTFVGERRVTEATLSLDQSFRLANSVTFCLTRSLEKYRDGVPRRPAAPPPPPLQAPPQPSQPARQAAQEPLPPPLPEGPASQPSGSGTVLRDVMITADRGGPQEAVLIVRVSGRLDAYNYTELGETLQQAIDSGERMIVLELSRLAFIDHTGLGVLVRTTTQLEKLKGQIRLAGVRKKLREAFSLSRLDVMFHGKIAQDEASAVADMSRQASGKKLRNPFKR